MYDVVVVGGGMAGLYCSYKLTQKGKKVLIIESSDRVGGRAGNVKFENVNVVIGAGIGRYKKDTLLLSLLNELGLTNNKFTVDKEYSPLINPIDILKTIAKIKRSMYFKEHPHQTFKEVGIRVLGEDTYRRFVESNGYTDFEESDVSDAVYNYGFEDNTGGWEAFSVPWSELSLKLSEYVDILYNSKVVKIEKLQLYLDSGDIIKAPKIVIATTITSLRMLFSNYSIYKHIEGQPFLRMYGKFDKELDRKHLTVVPQPIQKFIPIKDDVYMIVYNDNQSSRDLKPYLRNRNYINKVLKDVGMIQEEKVKKVKSFYWDVGTHYYPPLPSRYHTRENFIYKAQRPKKNIYVVGEVVAQDQGWTEGALRSVENIIDEI